MRFTIQSEYLKYRVHAVVQVMLLSIKRIHLNTFLLISQYQHARTQDTVLFEKSRKHERAASHEQIPQLRSS